MRTAVFAHRHYVKIAAIIADSFPDELHLRETVTSIFARGLADTNPNFDRDRFIAAALGQPTNGCDKR